LPTTFGTKETLLGFLLPFGGVSALGRSKYDQNEVKLHNRGRLHTEDCAEAEILLPGAYLG